MKSNWLIFADELWVSSRAEKLFDCSSEIEPATFGLLVQWPTELRGQVRVGYVAEVNLVLEYFHAISTQKNWFDTQALQISLYFAGS